MGCDLILVMALFLASLISVSQITARMTLVECSLNLLLADVCVNLCATN